MNANDNGRSPTPLLSWTAKREELVATIAEAGAPRDSRRKGDDPLGLSTEGVKAAREKTAEVIVFVSCSRKLRKPSGRTMPSRKVTAHERCVFAARRGANNR